MSRAAPSAARSYRAISAISGEAMEPAFVESTGADIDRALAAADAAFETYRQRSPAAIAAFLERIGAEIEALGMPLIARAGAESGLPETRLVGERARTVNQLRMFASLIRDGSWVEATIDRAQSARAPVPKPDLRRMLVPIGPVVVFGASNFPLAFSVAGGDTASALAAGNPVVVKAHPAHPGTCELVAGAIRAAIAACGMPEGVFSLVHGTGREAGQALVRHPLTRAVAFTGSLGGGRALFDAAAARPSPIPVYAEMASVNPVFLLPDAIARDGQALAAGLTGSATLGVGQFCTKPGVVVLPLAGSEPLRAQLAERFAAFPGGTMLHAGIAGAFRSGVARWSRCAGVRMLVDGGSAPAASPAAVRAALAETTAVDFLEHPELAEELFGPALLLVTCRNDDERMRVARSLAGQLTATIHAAADDGGPAAALAAVLTTKAGRVVFNGYPTGVEPCPSMQHGGPYPASTDARTTSVGTHAISRFCRPVCWQGAPDALLPPELQDANPRRIRRMIDGAWNDPVA